MQWLTVKRAADPVEFNWTWKRGDVLCAVKENFRFTIARYPMIELDAITLAKGFVDYDQATVNS